MSVPESDYGNDFILTNVSCRPKTGGGFRYVEGDDFKVQLKCTHEIDIRDQNIIYPLEAKNYGDLIDTSITVPRILVLMHVPKETENWLSHENDHIILRHSAYWVSLRGRDASSNIESVTIQIPVLQRFTPSTIQGIFNKRKVGDLL